MTELVELKTLLLNWDGQFESAESLLVITNNLISTLQQRNLEPEEISDAQRIIQEYQKLLTFFKEEKKKLQRESSRMNQSNQKIKDYVRFNQSSGFEFYY